MTRRTTHTFVILDLSRDAFEEIHARLTAAGYHHAFDTVDGKPVIDMYGIAVRQEPGA